MMAFSKQSMNNLPMILGLLERAKRPVDKLTALLKSYGILLTVRGNLIVSRLVLAICVTRKVMQMDSVYEMFRSAHIQAAGGADPIDPARAQDATIDDPVILDEIGEALRGIGYAGEG